MATNMIFVQILDVIILDLCYLMNENNLYLRIAFCLRHLNTLSAQNNQASFKSQCYAIYMVKLKVD